MSLQRPKHRYQQVADDLRSAIKDGTYSPGQKLPSQPQLAERYGINQTSIGNAIAVLRREGLVRVEDNVGAFVREIPPLPRHAVQRYTKESREAQDARGAFDSELRRQGRTTRTDLVQLGETQATPEASAALQVPEGAPVAIRKRYMFADDILIQIATSYIPWDLAEGTAILQEDTGPGGTYSRLEEQGHGPRLFTEEVQTRPVTSEEADALNTDPEQQVYAVTHIAWDADDRAVEVCFHVMPTYQWVLHYQWPANPN